MKVPWSYLSSTQVPKPLGFSVTPLENSLRGNQLDLYVNNPFWTLQFWALFDSLRPLPDTKAIPLQSRVIVKQYPNPWPKNVTHNCFLFDVPKIRGSLLCNNRSMKIFLSYQYMWYKIWKKLFKMSKTQHCRRLSIINYDMQHRLKITACKIIVCHETNLYFLAWKSIPVERSFLKDTSNVFQVHLY